jgi:hypothetical protein
MDRFFNNAGPTVPADHYCIDPLSRVELEEVEALIAQRRYFVLHAPRQTGKTTCLLELMRHLNEQGRYACVYSNIEVAQAARNDVSRGVRAAAWYVREDGSLDFPRLLQGFQQFFREHSESWIERLQYKEAGPQLLLQAFLQRIVNGGGRISREYGLGRRRTDLFIE